MTDISATTKESHRHCRLLLLGLLVMAWSPPSQAAVYQWIDENGVNHFSQEPPSSGQYQVTDFKSSGYDFNLGVGRGWRNNDEQWTIKLIIGGIPLGK